MIRKFLLSAAAIVSLSLAVLAPAASAQDPTATPTPTPVVCTQVGYNGCIAYPDGGLGAGVTPTATPRPAATATPVPVTADAAAAATSGTGDASIAFTGAESRVLGFVGAGLIGFGAVAIGVARRKDGDDQ